jgi:hypothetical protein
VGASIVLSIDSDILSEEDKQQKEVPEVQLALSFLRSYHDTGGWLAAG